MLCSPSEKESLGEERGGQRETEKLRSFLLLLLSFHSPPSPPSSSSSLKSGADSLGVRPIPAAPDAARYEIGERRDATSLTPLAERLLTRTLITRARTHTGVEDYVHRIGRTGRAGATGVAYTFFGQNDGKYARELCQVVRDAGQVVPPELEQMAKFGGGGGGGGGR